MKILHRYILRELAGPFLLSLLLLTFILFMRHMVFLFPKIAGKNLETYVIFELIILSLPFIIALVMPMAMLVAVIMSFGRLSADNEITALKALGVPAHRLMVAPLTAALALTAGMILFNDTVLPESNHRYKSLLLDIAYIKPTLSLQEGVIMDDFGGMGILVNRIENRERESRLLPPAPAADSVEQDSRGHHPADLFGIVITDRGSGTRRTIIADSGYIRTVPGGADASLTLFSGEIQEIDPGNPDKLQRLFFTRHRIRIPDVGGVFQRGKSSRYRSDREMTIRMIEERIEGHRRNLDSLHTLASDFLDSLAARPDSAVPDSAVASIRHFIENFTPGTFGHYRDAPQELTSLPQGLSRGYLTKPRTRLASVVREANFTQKRIAALEVEAWKKISIPFASLVFVLLGIPLGIISRRGGAGVSIAISMGVFMVYWIALITGETLADRLLLSPFWAMWSPNVLFLVVGSWLLVVQVRGRKSLALARGGFRLRLPAWLRRNRENAPGESSRGED